MTFHDRVLGHEAAAGEGAVSISNSVKSLTNSITSWVQSCADQWAAAALYDSLRGLSDAELHRRGLSRDILARDALQSNDQTAWG